MKHDQLPSPAASVTSGASWLIDGSQVAAAIRNRDWSLTPLGRLESWPAGLRTAVNLCLASRTPAAVIWGTERIHIYNDACLPLLGKNHPSLLGQDVRECWSASWSTIEPAFERAWNGAADTVEVCRLFVDRRGYLEESFLTFAFTPLRDESGRIAGVYSSLRDETSQVLRERRRQLLGDVTELMSRAETVEAACEKLTETLSRHLFDVPFSRLYLVEEHDHRARLAGSSGFKVESDAHALTALARATLADVAYDQETIEVDDVDERFGAFSCGAYPEPPNTAFVLPIVIAGRSSAVAILVVGVSPRNELDDDYRKFFESLRQAVTVQFASILSRQPSNGAIALPTLLRRNESPHLSEDVANHKRTEQALSDSETRFARFMQHLPGLAWIKDLEGRYVYANAAAERAFQTSLNALRGKTDEELFPPAVAAQFRENDRRALADNAGLQGVETLEHDDGELHYSIVSKFPIPSADGTPSLIGGMAIDITQHRRAEEALRESETRFRLMADAAPVLIWVFDEQRQGVYFNRRWLNFTGRTVEEELGDGWMESIHPDDREIVAATCGHAFEARERFRMQFRMRRADGEYRWLLDHGEPRLRPDGEFAGYIGTCIDVTDAKLAAQAVKHSEHHYRTLVEGQSELTCRFRIDGTILYVNAAYARSRGSTPESLTGANFWEFIPEPDRETVRRTLLKVRRESPEVQIENRFETAEGPRWLHWTNRALTFDAAGQALEIQSTGIDITERRRVEESLRENETRFRTMANLTPAMIWTADPTGEVTWSSDRWFEYTGATRDATATSWLRSVHPDDLGLFAGTWQTSLDEGTDLEAEVRIRRHDEAYRWFVARATPIRDSSGRIIEWYGSATDIHDRRQADEDRAFLAAIVESTQDAVVSKTLDGRIKSWNAGAEKLFGYTATEAVGRSITLIIPPELLQEEREILNRLKNGERIDHFETVRVTRDGRRVDISLTISPIRDGAGRIIGASKVARDISSRKRVEAALQAKEAELDLVTNTTPLILARCSRDLRYLYLNRAAAAYFGRSPEELVGLRIDEAMGPEGFEVVKPHIEKVLRGERVEYEAEISYEALGRRWLHFSYLPNYDEQREVVGWVASIVDITARKRAEDALRDSEDRFRMMADNIAQLAWICDELGDAIWYNRRWYEFTGTTYEEMKGWGWRSVHHPDHLDRVTERIRHCFETGTPWEDTFPLRGADGQYRWFLSRAFPIRDDEGSIVHWFGTNTDITAQLKAEEALREADRRKDEFLAMLAHELRNPLAPIRTGLELIKLLTRDPAKLEETRSMMERQTRQLITLVDDLLDVSRITRGKLELRKCRILLSDAVSSAVEASRPFIDEAGHELSVQLPDQPLVVHADPNRLAQVISNLLNNATKYTPERGHIELSVEAEGSDALIQVRDNGIGIPPDQLEHIFEMFAQIDRPQERGYTGLGIGLTLVKSLITMHGGSISAQSPGNDQGSTFRVRLPLLVQAEPKQPATRKLPGGASPRSRHRVLVVDDNRPAAEMLSMVVKMLGNEVRMARDGVEAIEVAADFLPEVVLMDIGMPRMNGYEAARFIREQPWGQEMLLVALTGWGQEEDKRKSKAAGFEYHIVKPAEPADLHELFAQIEHRREAVRSES